MARLSTPIEEIKSHYTVVVVGSGYGGAIAASRTARAGQQVCVLERGKELKPGEYPNTEAKALPEFQVDFPNRHVGSDTGLYDLRVNDDISVFLGCGLGGTSLVNANVPLRADSRVFEDERWPREVRDDLATLVESGYQRAEAMLRPTPYPAGSPELPKLRALERSAAYLKTPFYRSPINVTFEDGVNHVGVQQHACELGGDCVSGCNYAAKNTVLMNYLPDARNHGAELFTQVSVQRIERTDGRWLVYYQLQDSGREKFEVPLMFVSADVVVLAAGALGSSEILLRSKAAGLSLSDTVGHGFTGNGDVLGFGYNCDVKINGVGYGDGVPDKENPGGACITGIIDARKETGLDQGMVIEEGSIPGGLSTFLPEILAGAALVVGKDTDRGFVDWIKETFRKLVSLLRRSRHGAVQNTQTYLLMTHDGSDGRMYLQDDRLRIDWADVGKKPIFERANRALLRATRALGGTYVENPISTKFTGHDLITVHPLGGCVMAEDAGNGVVNHKGQVFSESSGAQVYEDLYVSDGSIVPRSLGVNPLLTISALAERSCELLAQDRGWRINYDFPAVSPSLEEDLQPGIKFTEAMRGYISTKVTDDYEAAANQGQEDDSPFEFVLTIISPDLDHMLEEESHGAGMVGTVEAPALSASPLMVTQGEFNLFPVDPTRVDTRQMLYRMRMTSKEGKDYYFDGFKVIHDDPGFDIWSDTTTLYITVPDGEGSDGPVLAKGILRIPPSDFQRQMMTLQVTNAKSLLERAKGSARFGQFFAGVLFDTYGSVFTKPHVFDPEAPPREKRPLRVGPVAVHHAGTSDGVHLRLTRYQGGEKGPVVLSHGLGVSSKIFSIDTIETNLLEYLYTQGYDVWLLDYRASIDLAWDGVAIAPTSTEASGNVIQGNYIGTNRDRKGGLGNLSGVSILNGAHDHVVGGTGSGEGNVVSGNMSEGVILKGLETTGNLVLGNLIGLAPNGTDDLGNSDNGVLIFDSAAGNVVGGTEGGARNVISGNDKSGIALQFGPPEGNSVMGNYIGTNDDGTNKAPMNSRGSSLRIRRAILSEVRPVLPPAAAPARVT